MTVTDFALFALFGGLGALARFLVDRAFPLNFKTRLPWGTITVNLSGSFLIGLLFVLVTDWAQTEFLDVIAFGFVGGYTTFSTAVLETNRLIQYKRYLAALGYATIPLVVSVALTTAGIALGLVLVN